MPGFSQETMEEAFGALMVPLRAEGPAGIPPSVRFGLESARLGLEAARLGKSLPAALSPIASDRLPLNALIGPADPEERADELREAGYVAVKIKVGGSPEAAAERVHRMAGALGAGVALRLDANRSWSYPEAVRFVRGLGALTMEYLEEPLSNPGEMERLAGETGAPLALDETLVGARPDVLDRYPFVRAIVLKPTLLGGALETTVWMREALRRGMTPVISAAYESGVGMLTLAALGLVNPAGPVAAGLDTHRRLGADVLKPRPDFSRPFLDAEGLFAPPYELDIRNLYAETWSLP